MAINISLYQMNDDPRKVGKTLGAALATHTITLKEGCSIDRPTVSFSGSAAVMATANYAYIDTFGRYYWIRDRNMLVNGVCELTLESDPWESFKTQLKNVYATITRNEFIRDGYLIDDGYKVKAYKNILTREFGSSMDDYSIIVMTVG